MINKQKLWFLTLFSIILVLAVYYVALPDATLSGLIETEETSSDDSNIVISSEDELVALRIENDEIVLAEMENLQTTLLDIEASAEDKNNAYEKLLAINLNKGEEQKLEDLILNEHNVKTFIKINDDQINVTISANNGSLEKANNIMRTIQKQYESKKYITVKYH